jgi:transcriptional regulator with XRE-family HTH domain
MRMLVDGRVRRTEAEWRAVQERFEQSGLSMSAFCRRSKLARGSFVKWRRRLAKTASPSPAFVEWIAPSAGVPETVQTAPRGAGEFELSLPGGVMLRWRA